MVYNCLAEIEEDDELEDEFYEEVDEDPLI